MHSVNLASFVSEGVPNSGSGTTLGGNGSGFIKLSRSGSSVDGNGAEWYIFKHRLLFLIWKLIKF